MKAQASKASSVRHAEKRRTSTCEFADRVARISVEHYKQIIPKEDRPPQTCMATIVSHHNGTLKVQSMGVGTKFLPETVLKDDANSKSYGRKVRDTHAEVLARRAFRRQLTLEILNDLQFSADMEQNKQQSILCRSRDDRMKYVLKPDVTLHMYTSSAPCGNATLKKFAKMSKEKFIEMGPDEWPVTEHKPIEAHSIRLGQFALLVKKDNSSKGIPDENVNREKADSDNQRKGKNKAWPAMVSDDWAPPGTTIVGMNKGSIHTCSDKICRWNCLGIQGSLLASLLEKPLYINSLTVGRKLTECICRRAVCCRLHNLPSSSLKSTESNEESLYRINHPSIMGTAVYMDESGVVDTSNEIVGQDVRFHSTLAWTWWSSIGDEDAFRGDVTKKQYECIDGFTGFLAQKDIKEEHAVTSLVSTHSLLSVFSQAYNLANSTDIDHFEGNLLSLKKLLDVKKKISPDHEAVKDQILTKHRILRQWKRRSQMIA